MNLHTLINGHFILFDKGAMDNFCNNVHKKYVKVQLFEIENKLKYKVRENNLVLL